VFGSLAEREIDIGRIVDGADESKDILRDGDDRLGKLQEAQGQEHWKGEGLLTRVVIGEILICRAVVMRSVLSDEHWETY
jgi:hypothetical protein